MSDSSPRPAGQWYWGGRERSREASPVPTSVAERSDEQNLKSEACRMPAAAPSSSGGSSSASALEENEAAEAVIEQLEEQWFCDNVVRWPSSRPGSPPGVIDKPDLGSPFRRQGDVLGCANKPRAWSGERVVHPSRPRFEIRRLSDGDHHVRRCLDKDQISRRRALHEGDENAQHRRFADMTNAQASSLPQTPTKFEEQSRFCSEASTLDDFSPLALPPSGPLMGVTEDEELENDLFAKMLANRPAKLTTINPGRFSRGPLQENNGGELPAGKLGAPKQRMMRRRLKGTKSLTDLEYEELRGLKDLGFEVSKDDLTPHVVRMFPGLQRQGIPPYNSPQGHGQNHSQNQNVAGQNVVSHGQTVLSQSRFPPVQHLLWQRRPDSPLMNGTFLDPSIDMKGQLKSWASEMASIVSIEC